MRDSAGGRTKRLDKEEASASSTPKRLNDSERLGYDAVMLPDHYKAFPLEPVRFKHKNGIEDLKKAARCLDMLMAFEEGDPDWWRLPGERASRRTYIV